MTEAEWLACADPWEMVAWMPRKARGRKFRLAACAWARSFGPGPDGEEWLTTAERYADGEAGPPTWPSGTDGDFAGTLVARWVRYMDAFDGWTVFGQAGPDARAAAARLIRDVAGNPFRPAAFDPRWRTADTVGLARGVYEDRASERMPILADALMDAGCEDEQIIGHCRGEGPHVRGCWVVDFVLGKE